MTAAAALSADLTLNAAGTAAVDDPLEQQLFVREVAAGLREASLQLGGLHCAACAGLIEQALLRVPGVSEAHVNAAAERARVRWDSRRTQPSALIAAVQAAGYEAVPDATEPVRALRRRESRRALWRLFVAGFCAMQVMMMATPSYVAAAGELAPNLKQLLDWGSWLLTLPVLCFSSAPFFSGAARALRRGRIGMDVPVALGIAITFVASSAATFAPGGLFGHEVYFDSLTMFVSFLLGARYLEMRARHRSAEALERSLAQLPETAWRLDAQGRAEAVSPRRLLPGDRIRVPVGQSFAADGIVVEGCTQADEALLSGESLPVPKALGAAVIAGSLNLTAPVVVQVQRVGDDTRLQAVVRLVRDAAESRPAAARWADRWAGPFLVAVLVLAAVAALVWSAIDPPRAVWVAVSVLIVTCPCALSLAVPATLLAAARGLARRGVLLQRVDALPVLADVQQVFFDKTGTLTEDRLRLSAVRVLDAMPSDEALARAASLAAWSSHPVSRALVEARPDANAGVWADLSESVGQGLRATDVHGREWRLGNADWTSATPEGSRWRTWLSCDGHVVAAFGFEEALRPGAAAAVQQLQQQGVQVTLLSGDGIERAQLLAARLGLSDVRAGLSAEDKLRCVTEAQAAGRRVAMVGDGVNDAPVLARADVSLAMGHGALAARGSADAVITSSDLHQLVQARAVARRAMRIVRQNLAWAAVYNAVCVPLALMGALPPWAAGLGMAASSLAVLGNALRAGR